MIQAQLADGRVLEFPDGTDPTVIQRTVQNVIAQGHPQAAIPVDDLEGDTSRDINKTLSIVEPAATLVTGAIAEPIAGLAGIVQGLNPFADEGAAKRAVEGTREALTFQPRTEAGQAGLQSVGETVAPVAEKIKGAEKFLGDKTFELTDSPALAAAAATIPTALMEVAGVALAKGGLKTARATKKAAKASQVDKFLEQSVPSIDQLKSTSREVFKEIDNLGISLQPKAYKGLVNKLTREATRRGLDADITPKAARALQRFTDKVGDSPTLTDIDIMRKVAQNAAKSTEPADAALGVAMINTVDEFLDGIRSTALKKPDGAINVGKRYKVARDLWGRARRSELLGEAFDKARLQASGFENGLRTQFRQMLNNKKTRRFFKKDELAAMRRVVEGSKKENLARLVGKLGFSEGSATQLIGGSLGVAGGAAIGGPAGAIAVPLIGQVSKKLAQRMTASNAAFADQVIRAGSNAKKITRAYLKNTPKKQRNPAELSELLMRNDIDLSTVPTDVFSLKAARLAADRRAELAGALAAGREEK